MVYELRDLIAVSSIGHCRAIVLVMMGWHDHIWLLGGCRGCLWGGNRVDYYHLIMTSLGGDWPSTPAANRGKEHLMVLHRGVV